MKLTLKTKAAAAPEGAPAATPTNEAPPSASAPKLKFKLAAPASADGQPADGPKPKRKYTKKPKVDEGGNVLAAAPKLKIKKRPREETGDSWKTRRT